VLSMFPPFPFFSTPQLPSGFTRILAPLFFFGLPHLSRLLPPSGRVFFIREIHRDLFERSFPFRPPILRMEDFLVFQPPFLFCRNLTKMTRSLVYDSPFYQFPSCHAGWSIGSRAFVLSPSSLSKVRKTPLLFLNSYCLLLSL